MSNTTNTKNAPASKPFHPQFMMVAPAKLHFEQGYNVRSFVPSRSQDDAELLGSIRANGIRDPLTVRQYPGKAGEFYIVAGHRRKSAIDMLIEEGSDRFKQVPVVLERAGVSNIDRTYDLVVSNQGKPLSQLERGEVCLRLERYGIKAAEMAERLGVSERMVREYVKLARADKGIVAAVKARLISETEAAKAITIAGKDAPEVVSEAVKAAAARGKATATAQDLATGVSKVEARKGAPLTGASGKTTQNAKTLATASKQAAKNGTPAPTHTLLGPAAEPSAKPASVPAATPVAPKAAPKAAPDRISGPFIGQTDLVLTKGGAVLCTCATPEDAKHVAHMLTIAWNNMTDKQREAVQPAGILPPAAPAKSKPGVKRAA